MEGSTESDAVRRPLTLFVAVDGSDASEDCFQLASKDLMKDLKHEGVPDHIVVASITDRRKDSYLPYNMKGCYLSDLYEAKILPFG